MLRPYPSDQRKSVAKHTIGVFSGKTEIQAYFNENESLSIDILTAENTIEDGIVSIGTIGLSEIDFKYSDGSPFPTRVELCAATETTNTPWKNALTTAAFILINRKREILPGDILENALKEYYPNTDLPHFYLTYPFIWNEGHFPQLNYESLKINWLQCIAIHEDEKNFIYENSAKEFEDLLLEKEANIFDSERKSVLK
ncbi:MULTISPECIES: suppressor of fused domain protein [Pseudomonas]|uniref:suppressor of fused domain protein n=1 Tax=Pseudomonas TaxID=286 RepID=UPI0023D80190|nr:suppressor of fused domain protein [Pseudomonas sp. 273]